MLLKWLLFVFKAHWYRRWIFAVDEVGLQYTIRHINWSSFSKIEGTTPIDGENVYSVYTYCVGERAPYSILLRGVHIAVQKFYTSLINILKLYGKCMKFNEVVDMYKKM